MTFQERSLMRLRFALALAAVAVTFHGPWARAGAILVPNSSFESPATTALDVPDDWTLSTSNGDVGAYNPYEFRDGDAFYLGANPSTDPANGGTGFPGIDGEDLAYVAAENPGSGLSQTLAATLTANTVYTLTVTEGARNGTAGSPFVFLGSTIELLAGTTVIASATDTIGPAAGSFENQIAISPNSSLLPSLLGENLTIELLTTNASSSYGATDWDNVRLDASTVPEPPALLTGATALIIALVAFAMRRFQRRDSGRLRWSGMAHPVQ
jgi:hypothetical protein